jgi:hypothetical protein
MSRGALAATSLQAEKPAGSSTLGGLADEKSATMRIRAPRGFARIVGGSL